MSIWDTAGSHTYYEHYRTSTRSDDLHKWVDEAYDKLAQYLDKEYLDKLRNEDFYGRLWELEVAEWLMLTSLKMVATGGAGPDFCVELSDGSKLWIEAVLSRPDDELKKIQADALASNGKVYSIPREQVALRYSNNLVEKGNKIKEKYSKYIGENDHVLIAISAFPPAVGMWPSRDLFELAILPINFQLVHFSTDGKPLDPAIPRPTHEPKAAMAKKSGVEVQKEFLYPGTAFSHIDGVMFSEASNLQQLLGTFSGSFNDSTNTPHIYQNFSGKEIPEEFTQFFYYHKWRENPPMMTLDTIAPTTKIGTI